MLTSRSQEMVQVGSSPLIALSCYPTTGISQANCYTCVLSDRSEYVYVQFFAAIAIILTTHSGLPHLFGAPLPPAASVMPVLLGRERSLELHTHMPTISTLTTCMPLPMSTLNGLFLPPFQKHIQQQHTAPTHPTLARQSTSHQVIDQSLSSSPTPLLLQLFWRKHKES
jgi:hypothetical protein